MSSRSVSFTMRNTPLALALALACTAFACSNCASTPQVVKDEAHVIASCDAGDVSAILTANGRIVADLSALAKGGAGAATAAVDALTQLAALHAAWAHCKATAAANSAPPASAPPAGGGVPPGATSGSNTPTSPPAPSVSTLRPELLQHAGSTLCIPDTGVQCLLVVMTSDPRHEARPSAVVELGAGGGASLPLTPEL